MLEEYFGGVIVINAANLEVAVSLRNKDFRFFCVMWQYIYN